jgi:hypothetical protein
MINAINMLYRGLKGDDVQGLRTFVGSRRWIRHRFDFGAERKT